jgi:uncharacterized low-complexity protein
VGGLFIPLVVAGSLAGRIVGGIANALDTTLFTVVGAAAFLGAGRIPAVVAELIMGRSSVTAYQHAATDEDEARETATRERKCGARFAAGDRRGREAGAGSSRRRCRSRRATAVFVLCLHTNARAVENVQHTRNEFMSNARSIVA